MTLQMDVHTDGQTDVGYHNIPVFFLREVWITIIALLQG